MAHPCCVPSCNGKGTIPYQAGRGTQWKCISCVAQGVHYAHDRLDYVLESRPTNEKIRRSFDAVNLENTNLRLQIQQLMEEMKTLRARLDVLEGYTTVAVAPPSLTDRLRDALAENPALTIQEGQRLTGAK